MGTYFIAYASTFSTVKKMLDNMFIGDPPGNYDRLLDFSTARTGSLFFAPTMDMLDAFSSGETIAFPDTAHTGTEYKSDSPLPPSNGSLGIGSLK
jgi:putative iron-dependent peroxidase